MNALDYIILGIAVLAAITGALKGFVNQAGTIAGIILAILVCRFFGGTVADYVVTHGTEHESLFRVLTYALVFAAVFITVKFIAGLFAKAMGAVHLRIVDRLGGALFCMAAWLLILSVLLNVYLAIEPADRRHFEVRNKPWRGVVAEFAPQVMGYIRTEQKA